MVLTASILASKDEWVLDSGCTFHMTPNKSALFDFKEINGSKVLMGNNICSEVRGIGKLKIINPDNSVVILTDVRYMPTIGRNLISYGQLEKIGCKYKGGDFVVSFYKKNPDKTLGPKVLTGKYKGGLYYLQGSVVKGEAAVARAEVNLTNIWHSRLGHMSLKNMNILVKEGYLNSNEVHTLQFCENCVLGKAHIQSFPTAKHITRNIGLHSQ